MVERVLRSFTEQLERGKSLVASQAVEVVELLSEEHIASEEKAAFLIALSTKGETVDEVAALALALRNKAVVPILHPETRASGILDVCGTGGDRMHTFNVSTTVALVVSAGGVTVAKHGNRAVTSQSGSADVLEALGIRIDLGPQEAGIWLRDYHFAFFFAPLYHPAFKQIGPARRLCADQGRRTVFNFLGPLLNPARPSVQMVGVSDPALCRVLAEVLPAMGVYRGFVVSGSAGQGFLDEWSILGPTTVAAFGFEPKIQVSEILADRFIQAPVSLADLSGGTRADNARIIHAILQGEDRGPRRQMVQLNAGAALVVAGKAADLFDGWQAAGHLIDSGQALAQLEKLQSVSHCRQVAGQGK